MTSKRIELLAPARDAATALAAISHGADAVYIGAPSHGARAAAINSIADIKQVVEEAHRFNARVYVTLNTLVYDSEIAEVEQLIRDLYRIGVDALIVQDMGILRMAIPPIALHASTQCDTRDAAKARFLQDAGFSQIVLARELSVDEIAEINKNVDVPLEGFIHGALCVCYSGDCRASLLTTGRSANRGECAQICRYKFDLIDGDGNAIVKDRHLLSLRDMNRTPVLSDLLDAGISSLKIEGRLKDIPYVKNVTAHYHRRLQQLGVDRTSSGTVELTFNPSPAKSFNRGFTQYFAHTPVKPGEKMASLFTPKSQGEFAATVTGRRQGAIIVDPAVTLHNGDGMVWTDSDGNFQGFRLNRVDRGCILHPASPVDIPRGTKLYRNLDKNFIQILEGSTAQRTISVDLTLRALPWGIALDATDCRGNMVTATDDSFIPVAAQKSQVEARNKALCKTGDTIYRIENVDDRCEDLFIPVSILTALRRRVLDLLDSSQRATYRYDYRRAENAEAFYKKVLTFHDNVANRYAADFYTGHGAKSIAPALEVADKDATKGDVEVMETRYCLRRECGKCLKTPTGKDWKGPLTLVSGNTRLRVEFDCANCHMHLKKLS